MLIRLFAYSNNEVQAKNIFDSITSSINSSIVFKEYKKIEPYWKIEGIYLIEVRIELDKYFKEESMEEFLKSIADKWIVFGNPIEEVLASEATEGCNYIKKGVNMINISY
ncbi:hypothetical protein [Clostridium sp. YIM B02555]|uniref:hypothetical protein n=1 Tax=Clostridium sp. YIM B02555 TaxID=2911968 RepID=UPI001EEF0AF3|nr:hypothetical protein [Clostridium sp. YIM B02555]